MNAVETVAATAAGVGLIAIAGRDIFDSLFHPEGRGTLARLLARGVWRAFRGRLIRARRLAVAGPIALIVVIGSWACLLWLGWALILWPHMPHAFHFAGPPPGNSLVESLNLSLVTLTTLGFGDITPAVPWLRILLPFEALLGFGLLSASISWLLLLYPALSRRRSLAYEVSLLRKAEDQSGRSPDDLDDAALEQLFTELTSRLVAVERDLVSFPISYYFAEQDERFSLPEAAPYLLELARRGDSEGRPAGLRLRARLLTEAIDDLASTASERFHRKRAANTEELLRAYRADFAPAGASEGAVRP